MQRYFLDDKSLKNGNKVVIQGADHRHITRVMRMKLGDKLQVVIASTPYLAAISAISDLQVEVEVLERMQDGSEAGIALTLLQGLPKGEKIDLIIMGSRGVTAFAGLFLGSVAHQVLNKSDCPVFIAK